MAPIGELGVYLKSRRETCGLSVDEVSTVTRIVPRVIRALEGGRLEDLSAPVYVRGFIRSYCEAVGVSPERAITLYETGLKPPEPGIPPVAQILRSTEPGGRPWPLGWATLVAGLLLVGGVVVYQLIPGTQRRPGSRAIARPTEASGVTMAAARETPPPAPAAPPAIAAGPRPVPADEVAPPAPPAAEAVGAPVSTAGSRSGADARRVLVVRAEDRTWIRITPENSQPSETILEAGGVREWRSPGRFTITLGNAGGVRLELDGEALPALGRRGEVIRDVVIPRLSSP